MKNLLIVVDYQKDFVDGALGFPGAESLDTKIAEKIRAYRERGDDVVFTLDTHGDNYDEDRRRAGTCSSGTAWRIAQGWGLYGETAKAFTEGDTAFKKPTFPSLVLADWLHGKSYGRINW